MKIHGKNSSQECMLFKELRGFMIWHGLPKSVPRIFMYKWPMDSILRLCVKSNMRTVKGRLFYRDNRPLLDRLREGWLCGELTMELRSAMECIVTGAWISWPWFNYWVGKSPAYTSLTKVLPGSMWGYLFYFMFALVVMSYISGFYVLRRLVATQLCCIWCGVLGLLLYDKVPGWSISLVLVIVVFEMVRSFRVGDRRCTVRN